MDKNNDGKFSKDELPTRLQERFDALDANKDGVVGDQRASEFSVRRRPTACGRPRLVTGGAATGQDEEKEKQ